MLVSITKRKKTMKEKFAIIGCGNIGKAIAEGMIKSGIVKQKDLMVTTKGFESLNQLEEEGFSVSEDNKLAVEKNNIIIIAVTPQQFKDVVEEIKEVVTPKHTLISVVSGISVKHIKEKINNETPVVRVMPNTAIAIKESMTCLAADRKDKNAVKLAEKIFNSVGETVILDESLMGSATALCACGVAFFLRAVRAASQGGIEIGFHAEDALHMAAQTAKGAAAMLLQDKKHPEREIDKVTTPQGVTISGLNQMEHNGFSSSMIKGIITAFEKAEVIYKDNE